MLGWSLTKWRGGRLLEVLVQLPLSKAMLGGVTSLGCGLATSPKAVRAPMCHNSRTISSAGGAL
jgi:hypothetical protein